MCRRVYVYIDMYLFKLDIHLGSCKCHVRRVLYLYIDIDRYVDIYVKHIYTRTVGIYIYMKESACIYVIAHIPTVVDD